jgi:hypothetical protein
VLAEERQQCNEWQRHPQTRGGGADGQEAAASQEMVMQQSARANERQLWAEDNGKQQEWVPGQEGDHCDDRSGNVQAVNDGMRVGGGRQR